jgi:hypothetical protein
MIYYILVGKSSLGEPLEIIFGDYNRKNVQEEFSHSDYRCKKIHKLQEDSNEYLMEFMWKLNHRIKS